MTLTSEHLGALEKLRVKPYEQDQIKLFGNNLVLHKDDSDNEPRVRSSSAASGEEQVSSVLDKSAVDCNKLLSGSP